MQAHKTTLERAFELARARDRMKKSVEATITNFGTIRTGRANPQTGSRKSDSRRQLKQIIALSASDRTGHLVAAGSFRSPSGPPPQCLPQTPSATRSC